MKMVVVMTIGAMGTSQEYDTVCKSAEKSALFFLDFFTFRALTGTDFCGILLLERMYRICLQLNI